MDIAQDLARRTGFAVFPCNADKTPATSNGFKAASSDPDVIAWLWRQWPAPLVGVATGTASAVSVLDVDCVKHLEARVWWRDHCGRLLPTMCFRSQSGGLHLYFRHADGVRNSQGRLARGVDTRGDGGYVIAWFLHGCAWLDETAPAAWPQWLTTALWPPAATHVPPDLTGRPGGSLGALARWVSRAPEGSRNASLFWAACHAPNRDQAALTELVQAACSAGLDKAEATKTVQSAWRVRP